VEQGSREWLALRLGIPTASEFHKIVTPTGKLSSQARKYAFRLVAEKVLNRSLEGLDHLEWIARGKELEPEAIRGFEFMEDVKTDPVGFITSDDGRIGASPDRLILGEAAALEIKCPAPATMIEYMLDGFGNDYVPQAQGQMLVGEFDYVVRYAYSPEMPPVSVRTDRDEEFIDKLRSALDQFCDEKDAMIERVQSLGLFAERAQPTDALDEMIMELGGEPTR
jgi:hypothetical protein